MGSSDINDLIDFDDLGMLDEKGGVVKGES
jgi:hypothetical protein